MGDIPHYQDLNSIHAFVWLCVYWLTTQRPAMTELRTLNYLSDLPTDALRALAAHYLELYNLVSRAARQAEERDATTRRTNKRFGTLRLSPRKVAQHLELGVALDDAITLTSQELDAPPETIRAHWRDATRKAERWETAARDQQIYCLMRAGKSNRDIAKAFDLHPSTVGRIINRTK